MQKGFSLPDRCVKSSARDRAFYAFALLGMLFFVSLLTFPDIARKAVIASLISCAEKIVPVLFPFAVIGALLTSIGTSIAPVKPIRVVFEKIFGISGDGVGAFVFGSAFGLPLGGKYALSLYERDRISRNECERLMGISMNPGIGFTVIGIGYTMWGSARLGRLLYLCQLISAIAVGILFKKGQRSGLSRSANIKNAKKDCLIAPINTQTKNIPLSKLFADAVKEGLSATLTVCAFTVFFSVITELASALFALLSLPKLVSLTFACFAELSCACRALFQSSSSIAPVNAQTVKILLFFAFGFSGISAHMQLFAFCAGSDIRISTYLKMKLLQGIMCATLGSLFLLLVPGVL